MINTTEHKSKSDIAKFLTDIEECNAENETYEYENNIIDTFKHETCDVNILLISTLYELTLIDDMTKSSLILDIFYDTPNKSKPILINVLYKLDLIDDIEKSELINRMCKSSNVKCSDIARLITYLYNSHTLSIDEVNEIINMTSERYDSNDFIINIIEKSNIIYQSDISDKSIKLIEEMKANISKLTKNIKK